MEQNQIKERIASLNSLILREIDPAIFVLNKVVRDAYLEITALQNQCQHNFIDGKCEYCDKENKA